MQDNISVIMATILTVVIIVLFPIYNVATRQDSITKNIVVKATTNFVDEARNKGYIAADDYQNYLTEINRTGNSYEVELEVHKPILIETDEKNTYQEKYSIDYTQDIVSTMGIALDADESVIKDNVYYLNDGYKFYVRVKNTNITQAQVLLDRLLKGEISERIVINYGGIVYKNEWAKGEDAKTASANITISRPMNFNEQEYKYEEITSIFDEYTNEYTNIYGLAVRLYDDSENANKFKFLLTYEDVYELKNGNTTLTDKTARESYIKSCFSMNGFEATVFIEEIEKTKNRSGTYNYKYMITVSNIDYDFDNNTFLNASVQIKAGSADTRTGTLGQLNSKEFIIIYESKDIEINYRNVMYDKDGNLVEGEGRVEYINVLINLNKVDDNIVDIRYAKGKHEATYFRNNNSSGTSLKDTYRKYDTEEKEYMFKVTDNDTYTVYAKDKHGRYKTLHIDIVGLGSDRLKFVLNWNTSFDFDMHLRGDNPEGTFKVYYGDKTYDGKFGSANLNQDNTSGGPGEGNAEIILLERAAKNTIYTCYIHKYSGGENVLKKYKPTLKVYRGDVGDEELIYDSSEAKDWENTFEGALRFWYILSYNANTREVKFIDSYMNLSNYIPNWSDEGGE